MSFFEVDSLSCGYGKKEILHDVSFALEKNTLCGVLGANGCGKTTLIKALCGILPSQGTSILDGVSMKDLSVRETARLCSYVPQKSGLTVDLSLLDAVLMGRNPSLGILQYPTRAMKERAMEALSSVGLADRADENFQTLSEGQKQNVLLARAFCSDGKLLLLDEPESALDFGGRYRMLEMVREWERADVRCALVTLHDPQLALNLCDRILLVKDGTAGNVLTPRGDPISDTENALREIYGPLRIKKEGTGFVVWRDTE